MNAEYFSVFITNLTCCYRSRRRVKQNKFKTKTFIETNRLRVWPPVQCDGCGWWYSQNFEVMGEISYSNLTVINHFDCELISGFFALPRWESRWKPTLRKICGRC